MQKHKTEELVRQAKRQDADAVQETILTCWEKLSGLRQIRYFKTWMTRILINLYNEGYRISEISKILGRPPSTIRTQLARGREQLARYYQDEEGSI